MKAELIKRLQAVLSTQEAHTNENTVTADAIAGDNNENDIAHVQELNMVATVEDGQDQHKMNPMDHSSSETAMVIDLVDI